MASEMKRASKLVAKEMKGLRTCADARARALDRAIQELAKQGVAAVPKILKTYGQYLTPAERALLEKATDEFVERLVEMRTMARSFRSPIDCI